jgi:hypothetical protein
MCAKVVPLYAFNGIELLIKNILILISFVYKRAVSCHVALV